MTRTRLVVSFLAFLLIYIFVRTNLDSFFLRWEGNLLPFFSWIYSLRLLFRFCLVRYTFILLLIIADCVLISLNPNRVGFNAILLHMWPCLSVSVKQMYYLNKLCNFFHTSIMKTVFHPHFNISSLEILQYPIICWLHFLQVNRKYYLLFSATHSMHIGLSVLSCQFPN